jgi:hypothetical protein
MKAKYVNECLNEKFADVTDPIKDMNIGYPESQLNRAAWKILKFIEEKGEEGASLTEIQFFIWTECEGHNPEKFWKKEPVRNYNPKTKLMYDTSARRTRGHWNTRLIGSNNGNHGERYPQGILLTYCHKNPNNKKWVLTRLPKPNEKFFKT